MSVTEDIQKMTEHPSKEQLVDTIIHLVQESVYVPMFIEGLHQKHDVLMQDKISYYPVFTDKEQVPKKYEQRFFFEEKPFMDVLENLDTDRIAVNPFTQNMILDEALIQIVLGCRK